MNCPFEDEDEAIRRGDEVKEYWRSYGKSEAIQENRGQRDQLQFEEKVRTKK